MKKNVVEFTTKSGNTYKLIRPTADQRAEMMELTTEMSADENQVIVDGEKIPKTMYKTCVAWCRAGLKNPEEVDDLTQADTVEIAGRVGELAELGK